MWNLNSIREKRDLIKVEVFVICLLIASMQKHVPQSGMLQDNCQLAKCICCKIINSDIRRGDFFVERLAEGFVVIN